MILIYTAKITSRKDYVFKHIFKRLLNQPYELTTDIQKFVGHEGAKMSYGLKPLGNEMFVWSMGLLDESGIEFHDINSCKWDNLPAIFPAPKSSSIPFDLFSAAFFLITRYEEYLPQVKDEEGRYDAQESIAVKAGFVDLPIIDLWCERLYKNLKESYPKLTDIQPAPAKITVNLEVGQLRKYQGLGLAANMAMAWDSIYNFKWATLLRQIYALTGLIPDPYKNEHKLISLYQEKTKSNHEFLGLKKLMFFFNVSNKDYGNFDQNIRLIELAKYVADYVRVGLRYSKEPVKEDITKETKIFEDHFKRPLKKVMIARSSIDMPNYYRELVDVERKEDYSMGYDSIPGFRASTCNPFYFYDLDFEIQTPLLIHPYALHYNSISGRTLNGQRAVINQLYEVVKKTHGNFIVLFDYAQFDNGKSTHTTTILEQILDYEL